MCDLERQYLFDSYYVFAYFYIYLFTRVALSLLGGGGGELSLPLAAPFSTPLLFCHAFKPRHARKAPFRFHIYDVRTTFCGGIRPCSDNCICQLWLFQVQAASILFSYYGLLFRFHVFAVRGICSFALLVEIFENIAYCFNLSKNTFYLCETEVISAFVQQSVNLRTDAETTKS